MGPGALWSESAITGSNWRYKLGQQRRIVVIILCMLAVYCAFLGFAAMASGSYGETVGLLILSGLNVLLGVWHARFANDRTVTIITSLCLSGLYFYLFIKGAAQGSNVLWALTLAPAYFFLLGHRWGLLFFCVALVGSALLFFFTQTSAVTLMIPAGEELIEAKIRFLSIFTMLGLYSFLLEYDRATVVERLLYSREAMRELASTDELTGLANRRTMGECLSQQERRSRESKEGYGLILGDIDHFKLINDSYGHNCGDLVITQVALALQQALRDHDVVSRWGGEEFLVVLPDTGPEGAMQVAMKLRAAIATLSVYYEGHTIQPTLSFGVVVGDHRSKIEDCIKRADDCLYRAKDSGRNCIVQD